MSNKYYVNSKNRKSDTPSNFSAIVPDGLLRANKDEYFTKFTHTSFIDNSTEAGNLLRGNG